MQPVSAISQQIWDMKYRFKDERGQPVDRDIPDTWRRIADALADTLLRRLQEPASPVQAVRVPLGYRPGASVGPPLRTEEEPFSN